MTNKSENNPRISKRPTKKKSRNSTLSKIAYNISWFLVFLLFVIVSAAAGGYFGYKAAINSRIAEYSNRLKETTNSQYDLAAKDYENGKFRNAKVRLDYINSVEKNEAAEELYKKIIADEDALIDGIRLDIIARNWASAIAKYESLNEKDYDYRRSDIEGLIYIAFRNLGVEQINDGYLESGIKNIDFSGNIGPVDSEADNLRNAASKYMRASGYWDIDWMRAMELYANIALTSPDIFDRASMLTAQERYVRCSYEVAKQHFIDGNYCTSLFYYKQGLGIQPNQSIQATADYVNLLCLPSPTPTIEVTPTPFYTPTTDPTMEAQGYYYYYYY